MSLKFGLDWKKYDHKRMTTMMHIINLIEEKKAKEQKKYGGPKTTSGRRPQG